MPEESFEQQARNMAEQFIMEPQPVVWKHVQAAIAPKRRCRATFIWFLLPLCVVCGLGYWLLKNKKPVLQTKAFVSLSSTKKQIVAEQTEVVRDDKKQTQKTKINKDAAGKKYNLNKPKTSTDFAVENTELNTTKKGAKTKNDKTQLQLQAQLSNGANAVKENVEKSKKHETLLQPKTHFFIGDNMLTDSSKSILQSDVKNNADTAKTNAILTVKTNDLLKQNKDSSVLAGNKKKRKNKWQAGVVAEAGAGWLGSGLLSKQSFNSLSYVVVPAGSTFTDTVGLYKSQRRKNGIDAALGLSVHKDIPKRWFFDGQMVYRYQQFSIQTSASSSSSAQLNGNVTSSDVQYRFHFANLYAGIGLSLFHKKNILVALQTGVDNSWLFSVKQKQNDTLKSLTAQSFQRWQPSLQFAVPVNIYANKNIRWQLSPFIRWGLRGLQNGYGSFQHHPLSSAGIRTVYFFK